MNCGEIQVEFVGESLIMGCERVDGLGQTRVAALDSPTVS